MKGSLSRIDFPYNEYKVKQKAVRNAYTVFDPEENVVLKAKQKLLKMKEEFPFTDPEGNEVFRVKAENIMDIAGDYTITDSETGEEIAVMEKKFSLFQHVWKIRDRNGEHLATIKSRGKVVGVLRAISDIFKLLPHRYTIENSMGEEIGTISGKFSIRDTYIIRLEDELTIPKETVLAAAITADALEGD